MDPYPVRSRTAIHPTSPTRTFMNPKAVHIETSMHYRTKCIGKHSVQKDWLLLDASHATVGRLASRMAHILRGKHKPTYTPHMDGGDYLIVINAEKIRFTGKKWQDKKYVRHTGYPGGQRVATPREVHAKFPERILEHAVKGMLPKNRLGRKIFRNLHVYKGDNYRQVAQKPKRISL